MNGYFVEFWLNITELTYVNYGQHINQFVRERPYIEDGKCYQ